MYKKLSASLLVLIAITGCSSLSLFSNKNDLNDVYADVAPTDILNDKPIVLNKRLSHIVTFEFDSFQLPSNAADVIEPHLRHLISNPDVKIALQGNASNEGSRSYNYDLAYKRISAVKGLFVELGLEPERVVELTVGETQSSFLPQRSVLLVY